MNLDLMKFFDIPVAVDADSYKAPMFSLYDPRINRMVVYGEFRKPFTTTDHRIVAYGIRHIVENILNRKWTMEEVLLSEKFYDQHNVGGGKYPWPKHLFEKFVKENDGYFPVTVRAVPEGSVVYPHVPVYTITAEGEYAVLATFLETVLTHYWYPSNVATKSRHVWDHLYKSFVKSVDEQFFYLLDSRLHDFGMRGASCLEAALIAGIAHLLNFAGSDTMNASFFAQFHLNGGKPVACSLPAFEHSNMMSWPTEEEAVENGLTLYGQYGFGLIATVADTFNYTRFLDELVPKTWAKFKGKVGLWVIRPDSGDPVEAVAQALIALDKVVGHTINSKGYKVLNNAAVIQGDGIDENKLYEIDARREALGYSAMCVAYGMGGGLHQKHNRDTMSFATKLQHLTYKDGTTRDVMKRPLTDTGKTSLPGEVKVLLANGSPVVFPVEAQVTGEDLLQVVYDKKPVDIKWPLFDDIKAKLTKDWLAAPPQYDPLSQAMKDKIVVVKARIEKDLARA